LWSVVNFRGGQRYDRNRARPVPPLPTYGLTTNTLLLVSVPFVVVTVIGPVVAPAGTTTFMNVFSTSLISVAATPLNNT
jgi:hypothetical protein